MLKDNLKAFRETRGLSQEQLAQKLHVVRQTVSKWERGSSVPDADMVMTLAQVFEMDVNTLLGEVPDTERPIEQLAIQSTLNAQNAAHFASYRRWTKVGFAALGLLCICLILAVLLFGRDFFRLYDGAQEGYTLQGTYELMEDLGKEKWAMGPRLSFAERADDGFDGFWQLSGFWDGDPMTGTEREEGVMQFDYSRKDGVINGGYIRTSDPNIVILQDQDHNEVGWAHVAYTLGNLGEKGLVFAEYQGRSMRIPKKSEDVFRYAQSAYSPWQLSVMAPVAVLDEITAESWFLSDEDWVAWEDTSTERHNSSSSDTSGERSAES